MNTPSLRFILFMFILFGCTPAKERIPDTKPMQSSSGKMVIYQLMTRLFGNTNTTNKPYGTIEENGVGKFNDINEAALHGIKELGVSHIWFTGIIEHAVLTDYTKFGIPLDDADIVKGRAGSPYAIKDYYDVNPDLAVDVPSRMKEFEQLVERTHQAGLKALIDFVPNHVARGYHSDVRPEGVKDFGEEDDKTAAFRPNNNFYYLPGQSFQVPKGYNSLGEGNTFPTKDGRFDETPAKVTGNDQFTASPGISEWFETIKLNYGVDILNNRMTYFDPVPDTWLKMKDILLFWTSKKVDGFRCDMAEMVPLEFWHWVIPQVKAASPEIVFIAEIYNPDQYRNFLDHGRFDYLYDKVLLYDTLRLLVNQHASSTDISKIQHRLSGINDNMLHFLENHDEQRIASPFFAGDPWKAIPAMVISATIDKAPVMIFFGQEVGEPGAGVEGFSGDDGRTTHFDYWGVPEHQKWVNNGKFDGGGLSDEQKQLRQLYSDILKFSSTNPAVAQGEYLDLTIPNVEAKNISTRIHVFIRSYEEERLIIVSGFNAKMEHIKVHLSEEAVRIMRLQQGAEYIGRDLLRSGAEFGLSIDYSFELDVPPYSSFIFKIK